VYSKGEQDIALKRGCSFHNLTEIDQVFAAHLEHTAAWANRP